VWRLVDLSLDLTAGWSIHYEDRTDTQVDGLLWGCLLALLFVQPTARELVARVTAGWRYWAILAVLVVSQAATMTSAPGTAAQLAVRPILIVLLVIGTVVRPRAPVGRALEMRPLRWLGRISYSLYLWQQLFLVWDGFGVDELDVLQTFPVSVVAAITVATLSHRYVERPAISLGRRVASQVRARHPARTAQVATA
jgi:peptidoglycan/LPS O-acetylase OafA/YrhL